ncbi:MAG: hypothetical protein CL678_04010 [Bdellovibrionaceae bacterium]|nr:hypothetical protein [Pseudobdellovibrionaceae bacterium]
MTRSEVVMAALYLASPPKCENGPYIWSTLKDTNAGIGTALNFRRPSFALAEILGAQWVGTLTNAHDRFRSSNHSQDAAALLGLADPFCTAADLTAINQTQQHGRRLVKYHLSRSLCRTKPLTDVALNRRSIVVVDTEQGRNSIPPFWITCAFYYTFRSNVLMAAFKRGVPEKPVKSIWVGVHFRWGDTQAGSPLKPAKSALVRTGAPLSTFAHVTKHYAANRTMLFTEGLRRGDLELFEAIVGRPVEIHSDSHKWANALAMMAQCDVLVGGSSTFFKLGARLCIFAEKPCTVVTSKPAEVTEHLGDEVAYNVSSVIHFASQRN